MTATYDTGEFPA